MPLSITVIAGLLGGLVALPMALWTPANMVLGVVITGWLAKLFTLGMAFLSIYVGIALQRSAPKGASIHVLQVTRGDAFRQRKRDEVRAAG